MVAAITSQHWELDREENANEKESMQHGNAPSHGAAPPRPKTQFWEELQAACSVEWIAKHKILVSGSRSTKSLVPISLSITDTNP